MITVRYERAGCHHRLTVEGHAGYSKQGNDIVCAAVSSISWTLIGYLVEEEPEYTAADTDRGYMEVTCTGGEKAANAFDMAVLGYRQIAQKYPQCVEVQIAE